jgi:type II secretory pathway predicted ATPase ExeA
MFKSYYGFAKNPFDKQSLLEKERFASCDCQEMVSRLQYLKEVRGIGVFTAGPGFGKTFALRCFAKALDRNLFQMAYICLSTVSVTEFYRQFCVALGLDPPHSKSAMFKLLQERLYFLFKEKRRPLVLAVDEAHELNSAILKDLKMIMNHKDVLRRSKDMWLNNLQVREDVCVKLLLGVGGENDCHHRKHHALVAVVRSSRNSLLSFRCSSMS